MNKLLVFLLPVMLLLILNVNAQPPFATTQLQDFTEGYVIEPSPIVYVKQLTDYNVNFFLYNISNGVAIENDVASCKFYIADSQGNLVHDTVVPQINGYWTTTITGGNFSQVGLYPYGIKCNSSNLGGSYVSYLDVTSTGYGDDNIKVIILLSLGGFLLLGLAMFMKNEYLGIMSGMLFVVNGVYIMIYGLGSLTDMYTRSIAFTSLGLGLFIFISAAYEAIADKGYKLMDD